jgi:hypothetical protein
VKRLQPKENYSFKKLWRIWTKPTKIDKIYFYKIKR